jgi:hypothetical protein
MSTPERSEDPGTHGYGGVQQEKDEEGTEHPLDDPTAGPRQDDANEADRDDDRDRR